MNKESAIEDLYKTMAKTISEQYTQEIAAITIVKGAKPSFNELKDQLVRLEKALTSAAAKLIETYQKETGSTADQLTQACHGIINTTIEQFVKTL